MKNMKLWSITLATLFSVLIAVPVSASAFEGLTVINAPPSNPLNARNYPSPSSTIARVYTSGDNLSATGSCKNIITGKAFRIDGGQSRAWKQAHMNQPGAWCQIWHEAPNQSNIYKAGWVRASFTKYN
jgi:hypothetical protein